MAAGAGYATDRPLDPLELGRLVDWDNPVVPGGGLPADCAELT